MRGRTKTRLEQSGPRRRWNSSPGLIALAAVALAFALAISFGTLDPTALGLVTLTTALALTAARLGPAAPGTTRNVVVLVPLGLGLVLALAIDAVYLPGVTTDPSKLGAFRPTLALVALLLATHLWREAPAWFRHARFVAVTLGGAVLAGVVIWASPAPGIDVWQVQQAGGKALLSGLNPYRLAYPNVYGPGTPLIDPRLLSPDGRLLLAFPYMPLSVLLEAPAALMGDIRWTLLVAAAAAAVLIRQLGRGSLESELASAFLLLQPRAFFQLELAWNEPIVLALVLTAVLAVDRSSGRNPGVELRYPWNGWIVPGLAAGLAASSKQYVVALLLPLLVTLQARVRWRALAVASAVAIAIALPFFLAAPIGFIRGVVEFQFLQPFRKDALSWPAQLVALGGPELPPWPAFILAGATYLITIRRSMSVAQAVMAAVAFWLVFVVFNKQAFCNYYWLAMGLLCASLALVNRSQAPETVSDG